MASSVPESYRRVALTFFVPFGSTLDFSEQALLEAFEYETYGVRHDISKNGFAFGKKSFDITVAGWKQDLADGLICKWDLLRDYEEGSFEYEFIWKIIQFFMVAPLFGYR